MRYYAIFLVNLYYEQHKLDTVFTCLSSCLSYIRQNAAKFSMNYDILRIESGVVGGPRVFVTSDLKLYEEPLGEICEEWARILGELAARGENTW